jgi:hypothetical protein
MRESARSSSAHGPRSIVYDKDMGPDRSLGLNLFETLIGLLLKHSCTDLDKKTCIQQVLQGARISLTDDGLLHALAIERRACKTILSSHKGSVLRCPIGRSKVAIMIGKREEQSWLQMERSSMHTIYDILAHGKDYFQYKATGRNVGPEGTSTYTETHQKKLVLTANAKQVGEQYSRLKVDGDSYEDLVCTFSKDRPDDFPEEICAAVRKTAARHRIGKHAVHGALAALALRTGLRAADVSSKERLD